MSSAVAARRPPSRRPRIRFSAVLRQGFLIVGALLSLFPFYWMAVLTTHPSSARNQNPPVLLPGNQLGNNLARINDAVNIWGALGNTVIVSVAVTASILFFDSLAAFAFAKFDFPGRNALFLVILATFLLPAELSTIPQFLIMAKLGWVSTLQALIVPSMVNSFGIFWLRQFLSNAVPKELIESSTLDGCGFFRQYLHVALPAARPALAFLGMFTFIGAWNSFMWPLIVLNNPDMVTLQVALSHLQSGDYSVDYAMVMTCSLISVLPLIVVFVVGAKQFLAGLADGAVTA